MIMVDGEPVFNQEQLEKQIKVAEKIKQIALDFANFMFTLSELDDRNTSLKPTSVLYDKFIKDNYTKYL